MAVNASERPTVMTGRMILAAGFSDTGNVFMVAVGGGFPKERTRAPRSGRTKSYMPEGRGAPEIERDRPS
jgi:hypothetical protein